MASRILGVDLGAYSVKVVVANLGFRAAAVEQVIEQPVQPGDEPHPVRAIRALAQILREHKLEDDIPYVAVSGDELFLHILEFGFRNLRRGELEKVVGGELESILPVDLEEMVYAFEVLPEIEPPPAEASDGDASMPDPLGPLDDEPTAVRAGPPSSSRAGASALAAPGASAGQLGPSRPLAMAGRVAPPTSGMRVLACAMRKSRARELLDGLAAHGIEPRGLIAAPAAYMRVAERLTSLKESASGAPIAVVDIGHEHTNVCVLKEQKVVYMRTLNRGGRDVTFAISESWRMDDQTAERGKHADGFVASQQRPATSEALGRIHDVVVTELAPLARELRQTFTACLAKTGARVDRVELVGGGSRLRGLAEYLGEQLGLAVSTIDPGEAAQVLGGGSPSGLTPDASCLATGVALEGASGRAHFDLRQGDLAFKADLSFLRGKLTYLAAMALLVIAFAAGNAYAALYKVRKAEKVLATRLAVESTEAFGRRMTPAEVFEETGRRGAGNGSDSPLPKMSAYDILLDINKRLPSSKDIKLDIEDVDIRPGRITIKAETHNQEKTDTQPEVKAIDGPPAIVKALQTQKCFTDVSRGDITTGANQSSKFSITIQSKCM